MDLALYGDSKGIIRLDPRTKLLLFLFSGVLSLSVNGDLPVILCAVGMCILYALCVSPWGALKAAFVLFATLFLKYNLPNSKGAPVIVGLIFSILITMVLFGFSTIMSLLLIIKTTRISQFLSAFSAMHLPIKIIIPVAVLFRFIPTVYEEWVGIRKAMAFRGISTKFISCISHPFRTIEFILIPLLFSSVNVMDELAAASMARGMDMEVRRTAYEEVKLGAIDYIVILLYIAIIVIAKFLKG